MLTKTEAMLRTGNVLTHSCQGSDKKVLFVCSAGILRSATAARIYADRYNTRCAGTEDYALIKISHELFIWADEIVFMNAYNYFSCCKQMDFDYPNYKVLGIPDEYDYMQPELINEIRSQYEA